MITDPMISMAPPHWPHSYKMATYVWMYSYEIPVIKVLQSCFDKYINYNANINLKLKLWFDWLIEWFISYKLQPIWYLNGATRTTNSHFHFYFELVSLQIHSHYAAQDYWLLHFPHRLCLFPTQNHLIMVVRDIHFSVRELCWKFSLLCHFDTENYQVRSWSFNNNSFDSADFRHPDAL